MWTCVKCGERHEEAFDTCWKCGTGRDGAPQPDPVIFPADAPVVQERPTPRTIFCQKCAAEIQPGFLHSPGVRPMGGFVSTDPVRWRNARAGEYPGFLPSANDVSLPVMVYRCGDCGYLEFYAH